MSSEQHGSRSTYNTGCHCTACREANNAYARKQRDQREERLKDPEVFASLNHGSPSVYVNWRCRCTPCREAQSERNASYAAGRKEANG